MLALKQGSVPDVIANKLDHLLILTSGTEQYLITCTNKKYKFLLTTTLTISVLKVRLILLDFADYLIYYTRKEVTYELLTHEYNYWRRADESILLP